VADGGTLRIGTSGWSYPTNPGSWTGLVYPVRAGRSWQGRKFDELAWYADRFDTVEVNSTFYRVPEPHVTRAWAARTPPGFEFSVKLFQKLTHPRMFLERIVVPPVTPEAPERPSVNLSHREARLAAGVSQSDLDLFRAAIDPLASAGKLGALLAQFPPSFKADAAAQDYLGWLLHALADYRVAVELRHRSWSDGIGSTLSMLNAAGAAWVQIDEPKFQSSIAQNFLPNVTGFYYLRLHGRNAGAWWRHEHAAERYNYLYLAEELDPFVEVAEAVKALVKKMYLYTNNHFEGKAVVNALMMRDRLGVATGGTYPPVFLERYPQLAGIVHASEPTARRLPSLS
jgi:uncharacterized protein YecE (DUF72 family)